MSYVDSTAYVRLGYKVNGTVGSLKDAVDQAQKAGWLDGAWWARFMGWYGGWTQFFGQNIQKPPVMPLQSTDDVDQWGKEADDWTKSFKDVEKAAGKSGGIPGPTTTTNEGGGTGMGTSSGTIVKIGVGLVALFGVGYVLSNAAKFRG